MATAQHCDQNGRVLGLTEHYSTDVQNYAHLAAPSWICYKWVEPIEKRPYLKLKWTPKEKVRGKSSEKR
jgi:hypothetical protein